MGDIAFNLLIFFVILARAHDDSHLAWQPVESAGHSKVHVLIDDENRLYLNGQELGIAQLADRIEEALGDTPAGERNVILKIHRETPALRFEPVIEAVSEAGGDLVHILEEERK
jgi:biopolymer transport protein ExbD